MKRRLSVAALLSLMLLAVAPATVNAAWKDTSYGRVYTTNQSPWVLTGLQQIDGKTYYFNQWGVMQTGVQTIGDKLYFFNEDTGERETSWIHSKSGKIYYAHKTEGYLFRSTFFHKKSGNRDYYAYADGSIAQGLCTINGSVYYFAPSTGRMAKSVRLTVNGASYYFQADGTAAANKWVLYNSNYYYYDAAGKMVRNAYVGSQYYVGADGVRVMASDSAASVTNQWVNKDGNRYYFGADGTAVTGIQMIGGIRYYFRDNGVLATNTAVAVGDVAYYVDSEGRITGQTADLGVRIAAYAQQFVGNPYVYGGTSLTNGADCSGFAMSVMANFGIRLLRVANDQMYGPTEKQIAAGYTAGQEVTRDELLPGDLVFYGATGYASHVAIYIGDGKVCHAVNTKTGIKVTDLDYVKNAIKFMRYWVK